MKKDYSYYHVLVGYTRFTDGCLDPTYVITRDVFEAISLIGQARKIRKEMEGCKLHRGAEVHGFRWVDFQNGQRRVAEHILF